MQRSKTGFAKIASYRSLTQSSGKLYIVMSPGKLLSDARRVRPRSRSLSAYFDLERFMVSRSSSVILVASALAVGLVAGFSLGRGGPVASAQVGNPVQGEKLAGVDNQSLGKTAQVRKDDVEVYDQLAREYERFQQVNRTFELVAKAVSPAVVHIVAQKTGSETSATPVRGDRLGRDRPQRRGAGALRPDEPPRGRGGASRRRSSIFLQDGRSLDARADLERRQGRHRRPQARPRRPARRPAGQQRRRGRSGRWVLALGSPFGLTHSVSQGIISARGRHMDELQDVENQDFLQTDAAINPGNSGGPLVNMKGEVIGINNSIASNGGGNEGVGFSIPINLARWIMNELIAHGRVTRGALGVDLQPDFRPGRRRRASGSTGPGAPGSTRSIADRPPPRAGSATAT